MNSWKWETFFDAFPLVIKGLGMTISLTFSCFLFSLVFGFVWVFFKRIPNRFFNGVVTWLMEFIRSTPPLVQLFFIFFAWPMIPVVGLTLDPFTSTVLGLGLHYSTYVSEIYRSGIESIEKGQWEAAKALNFSTLDKWRRIILPQAIPPTIPMLGNYLLIILKEVPLASIIGVSGILMLANSYGALHYRYLEPLTIVGILFLLISYPSAILINKLEKKINSRFDANVLKKKVSGNEKLSDRQVL
jgi:polar amino acid transport system permease protein